MTMKSIKAVSLEKITDSSQGGKLQQVIKQQGNQKK